MNMVLLFTPDFQDDDVVVLRDKRFVHIRDVIQPEVGDTVTVGRLNGRMGEAYVLGMSPDFVTMRVVYEQDPPAALPVTLLMALPRPKSLFKSLQLATTMGVKEIHLYNSSRVDKSFWQSRKLHQDEMRQHLLIGLEQAKDTLVPTITLHRLFAPFINDALPQIAKGRERYLAHPSEHQRPCPHSLTTPTVLAMGPERGLIDHEVRRFVDSGFQPVGLGQRILRVEQALPVILAKMFD